MILVKMTMLYLKSWLIKKEINRLKNLWMNCGKEEGLMVDKKLWQVL